MISPSCSCEIILAKMVENPIPKSIKFKTRVGSTISFKTSPIPDETRIIPIRISKDAFCVCAFCSIFPVTNPVAIPINTGRKTKNIIAKIGISLVEIFAATIAMTQKKISAPTRSSNAAIGIKVRVTGPEVFISLTMERDGAGAVASAIPPNRNARYTGIWETQKMIPNTMLTTRKVPTDSVMVVTIICLPAFLSLLQISSVPIIKPTVHSKILSSTSNHPLSSTLLLSKPSACGPKTIPVISQPKMDGRRRREISFPAKNATITAINKRNTSSITILSSPF